MSSNSEHMRKKYFARHFEVKPAENKADLDKIFAIRHAVYCSELGYEPENIEQRETDSHDSHSLHCLIRLGDHPENIVGCSRLILPHGDKPLPFEETCRGRLDHETFRLQELPRQVMAEFSRLAILLDYRHGTAQACQPERRQTPHDAFGLPRFPYVLLGLYLGTIALAEHHGIEYIFTLTQVRLARHLDKLGMRIRPIGPAVEHRGLRIPSLMRTSEIIMGLPRFSRPLWALIKEQMYSAYSAHNDETESNLQECWMTPAKHVLP